MKEQIIKAIDKGLMNVLSTDIEDRDIKFNHDDIKGNIMWEPADRIMQRYVKNLHETTELEIGTAAYNDILDYYESTHQLYKPETLAEALNLARKASAIDNGGYCLDWMDMSDYVNIVMSDGETVKVHEYTRGDALFVSVHVPALEYDMLIPVRANDYIKETEWAKDAVLYDEYLTVGDTPFIDEPDPAPFINDKENALNDYDGYGNTYNNINITKKAVKYYPAVKYVMNIKIPGYAAYIPALGQLKYLKNCLILVNYAIRKVGSDHKIFWQPKGKVMTLSSTERDRQYIWGIPYEKNKYLEDFISMYKGKGKDIKTRVLPVFRKF